MQIIIIAILTIFVLVVGVFSYWKGRQLKVDLEAREKEMKRKMYELAILKELGDRVGYSLNVQKIVDIITGSLSQFIEYSAVSYMLLEPERVVFKVHLENSVSRNFIDDIRERMLKSLSALLSKEFGKDQVEETLSGAILVEELEGPVRSFFNIPLVIGEKVVGILTVAHTEVGLYKEEEMTILYKITTQASQAVTRLQEVVKTEQRKLNAMVESMAEGVIMTDKDYRIVVVNPAARKVVGLEKKEEISIFDFIDNLGGKFDIQGRLEESVKLDKFLTINEVLIGDRFFQIFISPVKSNLGIVKGEILGGVVIFHDITHEKEIEKMREDFTSMMVHELRSPLDNIKKISEFIRDEKIKVKKKDHSEYIKMIYKNSSGMLELVNDLLDVAKLEAGKFDVKKEPSDIKEAIVSRLDFFQTSAKDSNIELISRFDKDMPEKIDFDFLRIIQVLNNLISNALKFTDAGGKVVVHTLLHKNGEDIGKEAKEAGVEWFLGQDEKSFVGLPNSLVVGITDTGIGISSENISHLFNKFKQFRQTAASGKKKGTGLGLAIAKGIVEAHQGTLGVRSKETVGSTFYFTLPIEEKKED